MYEKGNVSIREEKKIPRMFHSRSHFVKFYVPVSDLVLSTLQLSHQSVNTLKFADDMTVVISDQKTKDCIEKFVRIYQHIVAWCNK